MKIKNQRAGIYDRQYVVFMHYNPKTHQVWSDDLYYYDIQGNKYYGQWVDYDSVAWAGTNVSCETLRGKKHE